MAGLEREAEKAPGTQAWAWQKRRRTGGTGCGKVYGCQPLGGRRGPWAPGPLARDVCSLQPLFIHPAVFTEQRQNQALFSAQGLGCALRGSQASGKAEPEDRHTSDTPGSEV